MTNLDKTASEVLSLGFKGLSIAFYNGDNLLKWTYGKEITPDNLFEIGSLTKPFTSLLILKLASAGLINLDKFIGSYFSELKDNWIGQKTVKELLLHISGLPKNPPLAAAGITIDRRHFKLKEFLQTMNLLQEPMEEPTYNYSNVGYGILGHLASRIKDQKIPSLMRQEIFEPFNISNGAMHSSPKTKLCTSYQDGRAHTPTIWHEDAFLLSGGGMVATPLDLVTFVKRYIFTDNSLSSLIKDWTTDRLKVDKQTEASLGWKYDTQSSCYWHDGITPSFRAFIGFNTNNKTALCMISNSWIPEEKDRHNPGPIDQIGLKALTSITPENDSPGAHHQL